MKNTKTTENIRIPGTPASRGLKKLSFIILSAAVLLLLPGAAIHAARGSVTPNGHGSGNISYDAFSENSNIAASASLRLDTGGSNTLAVSISNASQKAVTVIQLYVTAYDEQGREASGWTNGNRIYTDRPIASGGTQETTWSVPQGIKSADVYIYSIIYSDGSKWGDKFADDDTILSFCAPIKCE